MEKIVVSNPFVIIFAAGTILSFFAKHFLEFIEIGRAHV